jgi:hypothetical protein
MHQGSGGRNHGRRGGQGKLGRLDAPFNPLDPQARRSELIVLVRMTAKS